MIKELSILVFIVLMIFVGFTWWIVHNYIKDKRRHRDIRTTWNFVNTLDRLFAPKGDKRIKIPRDYQARGWMRRDVFR